LLGGFVTTYLSWRVAFFFEDVIIAIVLVGVRLVRDAPYTGPRAIDPVGALLSIIGMGGVGTGILVWQEGGSYVGRSWLSGRLASHRSSTDSVDADAKGSRRSSTPISSSRSSSGWGSRCRCSSRSRSAAR
jgi:hypothetical protein